MKSHRIRGATRAGFLATALTAFATLTSFAQTTSLPAVTFSGYGTVGTLYSTARDADYLVDVFKPNGPGYSRRVSFDADSRIGAQVNVQMTPQLSATVQVISEQRYDNSYRPTIEWANLKYQIAPDIGVRVGRVVLPVFMVTDSRRVGYSNPWARPPVEMYGLVPLTHSDGVDLIWRSAAGSVTNAFQVTAGESTTKFPSATGGVGGVVDVRRIVSINDAVDVGSLTLRAIYGRASLTIDAFDPLTDAFRMFGPEGDAIASRLALKDRGVHFVGVGASYDPGNWFVMAEAAQFETNSLLGRRRAGYVSGGYRTQKFTPYATWARIVGTPTSDAGVSLVGLPPAVAPVAGALNAALNQQLMTTPRQSTLSVGVRWDALKSAAFKLQLDWVRTSPGSIGSFGNVQPGFRTGSTTRLASAVLDFVF